ncbi:MAG: CHRD domain-containing protein [Vicinamibacterales bacterium]
MRHTIRTGLVAAAMVVAAATSPKMQTNKIVLTAQLEGGQEVPGIASGSVGNAVVTIDRAAGTISYEVNIYNLPTGIVASHIHAGSPGVAGPVILNFTVPAVGQSNDFKISGSLTAGDVVARPAQGIGSFEDAIVAIASGGTYVNVHTQANPGGEIRGQLCPDAKTGNPINGVVLCTAK